MEVTKSQDDLSSVPSILVDYFNYEKYRMQFPSGRDSEPPATPQPNTGSKKSRKSKSTSNTPVTSRRPRGRPKKPPPSPDENYENACATPLVSSRKRKRFDAESIRSQESTPNVTPQPTLSKKVKFASSIDNQLQTERTPIPKRRNCSAASLKKSAIKNASVLSPQNNIGKSPRSNLNKKIEKSPEKKSGTENAGINSGHEHTLLNFSLLLNNYSCNFPALSAKQTRKATKTREDFAPFNQFTEDANGPNLNYFDALDFDIQEEITDKDLSSIFDQNLSYGLKIFNSNPLTNYIGIEKEAQKNAAASNETGDAWRKPIEIRIPATPTITSVELEILLGNGEGDAAPPSIQYGCPRCHERFLNEEAAQFHIDVTCKFREESIFF